ncbi:MAG: cellulose biosynthesis cyclic di-GMP-binding regulatory protein BcsB [Proteobacteria bacterium]|uniref:Cyclic di-GMP-binding protein n=1 Tax=Candidatus Avisuccinivibrio stercorigallinarum TaxID=2840704 RepID=A0A9D9DE03_9GAMM|nr:cellulose biosynthesis cyclic di-GMP-binding regulatory protein BcsB [Candidatus Avisuccinivibrio stercorigallinarum]
MFSQVRLLLAAAAAVLCLGAASHPATAAEPVRTLSGLSPDYIPQQVLPQRRILPLTALQSDALNETFHLSGLNNKLNFQFAMRADEILTRAEAMLTYTPSPALIPLRSQLNVYLNGQLQQSLPITEEELGQQVQKTVSFNALQLKDQNRLTLEFIGHYTDICEDPANSTLWLTLDSSSTLALNAQKIRLSNELAFFPAPFVDTNLSASTELPLVFGAQPTYAELTAAAVLSSYFGALTDWRGINFPVFIGRTPVESHCIVFAVNGRRPDFLAGLPDFEQPTIMLRSLPHSAFAKMLILGGRDEAQLMQAVQGLILGSALLSGDTAVVDKVDELSARRPYDAPNFVDTSRPVTFGSLMEYEGQLTTRGIAPYPINLRLRLPPDLFIFNQDEVIFKLNYRYTRPDPQTMSQLRFLINGTLVDSFALNPDNNNGSVVRQLPLLSSMFELFDHNLKIPALSLQSDNTLRFDFNYGLTYVGGSTENCRLNNPLVHQAEIEPSSSIDLTGFYHYTRMPNLRLFVRSAYPYCVMADLSESVVLLESNAEPAVLSILFNLMGRFGAQIGYPALKLTIDSPEQAAKYADKDLIVINDSSFADKLEALPGLIARHQRLLTTPSDLQAGTARSLKERQGSMQTALESAGSAAMLLGFQSPFNEERSVTALLCEGRSGCELLNQKLADPGSLQEAAGSAVVIRENSVKSFDVGDSYFVGDLPLHQKIWYALSSHSLLLVFCTLLCALLLASALYYLLRGIARKRLGGGSK